MHVCLYVLSIEMWSPFLSPEPRICCPRNCSYAVIKKGGRLIHRDRPIVGVITGAASRGSLPLPSSASSGQKTYLRSRAHRQPCCLAFYILRSHRLICGLWRSAHRRHAWTRSTWHRHRERLSAWESKGFASQPARRCWSGCSFMFCIDLWRPGQGPHLCRATQWEWWRRGFGKRKHRVCPRPQSLNFSVIVIFVKYRD